MENPRLEVGMEFKTIFKKTLTECCVQEAVDFKWKKNKPDKLSLQEF